jgi:hypothetical protein
MVRSQSVVNANCALNARAKVTINSVGTGRGHARGGKRAAAKTRSSTFS